MILPLPIILAAGKCSRFYPYADQKNHKSMVFLTSKPILQLTIEGLKRAGFNEVVIVVNKEDQKIKNYFSDKKDLGIKINYIFQDKPKGMGDALLCVKNLIKNDFLLLNANQINIDNFISQMLNLKIKKKCHGVMLGTKVSAIEKYGIFQLDNDKAIKIIEKPKFVKKVGDVRVVGIYLLSKDFIDELKKVRMHENSLEEALNNYFLSNDVRVLITNQETFSLKYPWDLFKIKNYILKNLPNYISPKSQIKKNVIIEGSVYIDEGAIIYENATIKGPCYIGKNSIVGNCALVRENSIIAENSVIGFCTEIKNSILMKNSSIHSGFLGDSIIGEDSHLGAGFISANKRFDNKNITVKIKGKKVDTNLNHFGTLIGSHVNIGVNCRTMPGVIIGNNQIIMPGQTVFKNVL